MLEGLAVDGPFQTASEAIAWIESQVSVGIKPGLQRMNWLMERLDYPHRGMKWIHVAGTNGKGSTCAFLAATLRKGGFDTGLFTSPYLTSFQERIEYNGLPMEDESLIRLTNQLYPLAMELSELELGAPSMFELTTTLAILYYATVTYPDYVVWETGLGGRLDSTNIVIPVLSVITPIGLDHTEFLGTDIETVASEKAGIIKSGVPVVCGPQEDAALKVIRTVAQSKHASLYAPDHQYTFQRIVDSTPSSAGSIRFDGPFGTYPEVPLGLYGQYQGANAATALMAIEVLRQYMALVLDSEIICEAFQSVRWPGRMEWLDDAHRLLVDGAHNPHGARALAQTLQSWKAYTGPITLLVAMTGTKDAQGVLAELMPFASEIILTQATIRQAMPLEQLIAAANGVNETFDDKPHVTIKGIKSWQEAITYWQQRSFSTNGFGLACGSLYWVADVRSWFHHQREAQKGW